MEIKVMILVLFLTVVYGASSATTTLKLERMGSTNVEHSELVARDRVRHGHVFQGSSLHVPQFPLQGTSNPYLIGRYFTRMKLGSPAREYNLIIDTGSDITWVNCIPCTGCPSTSRLIELSFYDPHRSSSAAPISCADNICKSVAPDHQCSSKSLCSYSISYGDGSSSSGYYVSDMLNFDSIIGNPATANSSANIVFGCSDNVSGRITTQEIAVDGLFGLGHQRISILSQLASRGVTPNIFSHCLKGEGGGILVLGEIQEPGIIYSPLDLSQSYYNVNLVSISIGGRTVPIDPKVFANSRNRRGTVVDSGTTLAYLAEEAYDPFVTALRAAVLPSVRLFSMDGNICFQMSTSIRDAPLVNLNFAGGASMVLKPEEYLVQVPLTPRDWCLGFQKNQLQASHGLTILGELVLKDKIIVYDLARQRLGWADYDCSSGVNVSLVPPRVSSSSRDAIPYHLAVSLCIMFAGFL